ncbi:hypothetical protein L6164_012193 [Bauhinia variegata]|uniref:Uncharacterized protein n=1 Tax=Bauhinia variegata TaxID=167791 RepID=A0ACB9PAU0_BAUVA|nr:hypothetical protein L6164_012193 [Bauhinia variegata]
MNLIQSTEQCNSVLIELGELALLLSRAKKPNGKYPSQAEMYIVTRRGNNGKQLDKKQVTKLFGSKFGGSTDATYEDSDDD